ncbi:MAG: glycoside hydrolase [Clostridia bacterium]|nr:glycoside hydrolase [Clostridia bacterium]
MKKEFSLAMEKGEVWWGGAVLDGVNMPLHEKSEYTLNCVVNETYNQVNGLFTSNLGRYIYVGGEFVLRVKGGVMQFSELTGDADMQSGFEDLRGAFRAAYKKHCSRKRDVRQSLLLKPQYCTWMHCLKEPSQEKVLAYAQSIVDGGMPVGALIIDDCWQADYGDWEFSSSFTDPKKMIEQLHQLGFEVMLWICPFVNESASTFATLKEQNALVRDGNGNVAMREWWNGVSAVLDLTAPSAQAFFQKRLDDLTALGADGFKFDAGDAFYYKHDDLTYAPTTPNGQSLLYAEVAAKYEASELRACVGMGGEAVLQRLCDKRSSWHNREGMGALVPDMLQAGMSGYIYCCADMIGGGQGAEGNAIDYRAKEELFLRACQCAALMPCMQFSLDIWSEKVPERLRKAIKKYASLRVELGEYFKATIESCEKDGEPILRPLEYQFPNEGFALVNDQFMLGEKYLVAPIVEQGVEKKKVRLPKGKWKYVPSGEAFEGGAEAEVSASTYELPYFERI